MNRYIRMRKYNPKSISGRFDTLFPQTVTNNILRSEDAGVLESYLLQYDRHLDNDIMHINRALSEGTARALSVRIKDAVLVDNFPLLLTLHTGLECEPTLSFNGGDPHEIISASGDRIPGGQIEGTAILLVWKEYLNKWVLLSSDNFTDITKVVLPVESEYVYTAETDGETLVVVPGFNKKADKLIINYEQTILRYEIDFEYEQTSNNTVKLLNFSLDAGERLYFTIISYITTAKRGHFRYDLKSTDVIVPITENGTTQINIPVEADGAHSVVVNYQQTILRNTLDYDYTDDHTAIVLKTFALDKGEELVFTITQFVEAPGELVPNNWGATGNYRYALNVIHESYTATEDNVAVIPVPNYNNRRDHIAVIRNNHLYIFDVDYTIDEIGNIVLLKEQLNTGDEIFFTILQGAMMDVPNFNVIQGKGQDGQHILVDMSYHLLCDYYTLLVRLKHDLLSAPTLKCVDGPAEPICDCFGTPVRRGYKKGSYLWLVYSEKEHTWYSLGHGQLDITELLPTILTASGEANFVGYRYDEDTSKFIEAVVEHGLGEVPTYIDVAACEPPGVGNTIGDVWYHADENYLYVGNTGNATSKFRWTVTTQKDTVDIRTYIDQELEKLKQRPGTIVTKLAVYEATADGISTITSISGFNGVVDKLIVNFNQTILRENTDYIILTTENGIQLKTFTLSQGDILQFTIFKQEDDL